MDLVDKYIGEDKEIMGHVDEREISEVSGYTLKAKDKKVILAFIKGYREGKGNSLWIEGDYLFGPAASNSSNYIAKRDGAIISTGRVFGNVSQTYMNFIRKNS